MSKRLLHKLHSTVKRYGMLAQGDQVIVAVSGGIDSLCMLRILQEYNQRQHLDLRLFVVHVDPGFPDWQTGRIEKLFRRWNVEYLIARTDVPSAGKRYDENICYVCSRARRNELFEIARRRGIRKIALAHHLEDVNETYLMNLLYTASARTLMPKQQFFKGQVEVVRPLYDFDKPAIVCYTRVQRVRAVRNLCPGEKSGRREVIRRFLSRLYHGYPRIRNNIFTGIRNIKTDYLPH